MGEGGVGWGEDGDRGLGFCWVEGSTDGKTVRWTRCILSVVRLLGQLIVLWGLYEDVVNVVVGLTRS